MAKARAGSGDGTSSKDRPASSKDRAAKPGRTTPPKAGRTTPPQASREVNKRYTAPIPRSVRQSPRWFGPMLLILLVLGLLLIVGNYVGIFPGGTSNWYLIGGLVGIVVGAMMATQYH